MTHVQIASADDFIAAIPYVMGFHPQGSVIVALTSEGMLQLMARLDVIPDDPAGIVLRTQVAQLLAHVPGCGANTAHLVLYEASSGRPALEHVRRALLPAGLNLALCAEVRAGRWRHHEPDRPAPGHDPVDREEADGPTRSGPGSRAGQAATSVPTGSAPWHPLPSPSSCAAVAELVGRGRYALADRGQLVARLRPARAADRRSPAPRPRGPQPSGGAAAARGLGHELRSQAVDPPGQGRARAHWLRLLRPAHAGEREPRATRRAGAHLATDLLDKGFRDAVIAAVSPGAIDARLLRPADRARVLTILQETGSAGLVTDASLPGIPQLNAEWRRAVLDRSIALARISAPPLSGQLYALVAFVAGGLGEGAILHEAIGWALSADPDLVLIRLLDQAMARGINPFLMPRMVAARWDDGLAG